MSVQGSAGLLLRERGALQGANTQSMGHHASSKQQANINGKQLNAFLYNKKRANLTQGLAKNLGIQHIIWEYMNWTQKVEVLSIHKTTRVLPNMTFRPSKKEGIK